MTFLWNEFKEAEKNKYKQIERINAIKNMIEWEVPEEKILTKYSKEELEDAKEEIKEDDLYPPNTNGGRVLELASERIFRLEKEEGERRAALLFSKLFADKRIEDVKNAAADPEVRQKLYKEYGINCGKTDRAAVAKALVEEIAEFRKEQIAESCYKYDVKIKDVNFATEMTDNDIMESARLSVEIMEELKRINYEGLGRKALDDIVEESKSLSDGDDAMLALIVYKKICTERLEELIEELDKMRHVDGIQAMMFSNPALYSAIYSVYDMTVDKFDDEKLYFLGAYFIMRAVMHMNSREYFSEEN